MHAKHVGRFVQERGVRRGRDGQVGRHLAVRKVRSGHSPCSAAAGVRRLFPFLCFLAILLMSA